VHSYLHHAGPDEWDGTVMTDGILVEHGVVVVGLTPRAIRNRAETVRVRVERAYEQARRRPRPRILAVPIASGVVSEAFFTALGDGRFRAEEACAGPWSPDLMHGGPPSALLVRACERAAEEAAPGLVALRAGVDFLSAVPVGLVAVVARVVRTGRRIALTEAVLEAGGREVLHARVWHVRTADEATPALDQQPPAEVPPPEQSPPTMTDWTFPTPGRSSGGSSAATPSVPGRRRSGAALGSPSSRARDPSGLQRAVLSADSGNGISANLDWAAWSFVNIDLDVHLSRPLVGDWVLLDATTRYEESGTALAASSLWDERGRVGRGAQTLVVAPRTT
jgi:hypothetical protein